MSLGAIPIVHITGVWCWGEAARLDGLHGVIWERVTLFRPRPDLEQQYGARIVGSYREMRAENARHLYVLSNHRYVVDHRDAFNPDLRYGLLAPARHVAADVPGGKLLVAGAVAGGVVLGGMALDAIFGGGKKKWDRSAQRYRGKDGRFKSG